MRRLERVPLDKSVRLVRDGEDETDKLEAQWKADPAKFKPKIKNAIYGSVKDTLFQMQYAKCCFCESVIDAGFPGDVEHFRPKKEVTEDKSHPGYWWLAYEWSNLLLSCNRCNRAFKKNHFPLTESSVRAKERGDDLATEEPLLIDPSSEDPNEHIGYREHMLVGKTERGKATIELLGLNRQPGRIEDFETGKKLTDGLRGARERHFNKFKRRYQQLERLLGLLEDVRKQPPEQAVDVSRLEHIANEEWKSLIAYLEMPQEPYWAMVVAALEANFTLDFQNL